jgi:hypothetical protein
MDIDNGGRDGKPEIIVLPKYMKAAEAVYHDFLSLEKAAYPNSTNRSSPDSRHSPKSLRENTYAAQMAEFLAMTNLSDSDSNDCDAASNTSSTSQTYLTAPKTGNQSRKSTMPPASNRRSEHSYVAVAKSSIVSTSTSRTPPTKSTYKPHRAMTVSAQLPPTVIADPDSKVSTLTNAQRSDLLLEMHAMLKDQKQEIKKLKKRHELSKRTTLNLQHHIDSICDSLDELSRKTFDSDISSALSMMSSKARSNDSDSLDSKECPDTELPASRPTMILFSKVDFRTFDGNTAPVDIHHDHALTDTHSRHHPHSPPKLEWISPKQKKKHVSSLKKLFCPPYF